MTVYKGMTGGAEGSQLYNMTVTHVCPVQDAMLDITKGRSVPRVFVGGQVGSCCRKQW
jgi:hypothetical protein